MNRQGELFERAPLKVTPTANGASPPLWVKQLRIRADATTILRTIEFRPGLNII
jgi:hypothetical protein